MTSLDRLESLHRPAFVIASLGLVALAMSPAGEVLQSPVALIAWAAVIAVLGLPHGAFDLRVARAAGLASGARSAALFSAAYLAIAMAFGLMWRIAPGPWLVLFLLISAVHFSEDWLADLPRWGRLGAAVAVVSLPVAFHPEAVTRIFAALVPAEAAQAVASAMPVFAPVGLAVALAGALARRRRDGSRAWQVAAELLAIAALAAALPPLLYFVAYFCGMHSARQTLHTARALGARSLAGAARMAAPLTVVTILGIAALLPMLGSTQDERLLRAVFVGLACLTVPHMALNLWIESRDRLPGDAAAMRAA